MRERILELTPGRESGERGPLGIEQVLSALHPLALAPLRLVLRAESRHVRFRVHVPEANVHWVESLLYAQYPDAACVRLDDLPGEQLTTRVSCSLQLRRPGPFPIKRHPQLIDPTTRQAADPLDLLLHALSHLPDGHVASISFLLAPIRDSYRRRTTKAMHALLSREVSRAEYLVDQFVRWSLLPRPLRLLLAPLRWGLLALLPSLDESLKRAHSTESSSTHERESDIQACLAKVRRHLFQTNIDIAVEGPGAGDTLRPLLAMVTAAFTQFDLPGLNGFVPTRSVTSCVLSTEELATLWHLPVASDATNHLGQNAAVQLPPPANLPPTTKDHTTLGETTYRQEYRPVGLSVADRRRHVYVIGKSGSGKTTILERLIAADIRAGRGVGLIDPHGDLATSILHRIPGHRTNDVIVVDPGDADFPLSFNPLDVPPERAALAADAMLSTFMKLFASGEFASWGPRLEDILRNTLMALTEAGGSTLLDVLRMLEADDGFRASLLRRVRDPVVSQWWREEFPKLKANRREDPFASVTNKLRQLLSIPLIRNMLSQRHGKLRLRAAMDDGKIVLCNLSKGAIGERTASFIGALLVTRFQLDAMSRADVPEHRRRDFALYIDEFQNFASPSFADILSEARKYRLSLTLANQYLGQMPQELKSAVLGNIGTILCLQVGIDDAEVLAEQLGPPLTPSDLLLLPRYEGFLRTEIDSRVTPPFSIRTLPPENLPLDRRRAQLIKNISRARYASRRSTVERAIARAL